MRSLHILVHGRVQGVGYRAFVEREARRRGLSGWVRNRREGTVEAVFAGPADQVDAMLAACRRGPPGAGVLRIDQAEAGVELRALGAQDGFRTLASV
ncbi:MAG TPA: acylphosphatase [Xanthobacteraceae bacterium]|nr:acylphosphatase [Xanthobacteraceae bacterium]